MQFPFGNSLYVQHSRIGQFYAVLYIMFCNALKVLKPSMYCCVSGLFYVFLLLVFIIFMYFLLLLCNFWHGNLNCVTID